MLNLTPLANALKRLQEGWQRYQQDISDEQIRDGLIQRFEFTYEISHKMLKRYLEQTSANPAQFDQMTFQDLIRTANEQDLLLGNWTDWRQYRDMLSRTSHTYDEAIALAVVGGIEKFIAEAVFLLEKLQNRPAGSDE
ncbi:nucleotidyltransferase substrate binding protein [Bergeriella denitrificans]|uniref:Nucleotidyltransferase substrate binding protein, HI0074 family n=1 Tax=Bergeriella denitrificans TaxID=494 RepID=A0A378UI94_BERDE|nr:nucleotidyltransferase substrate binding protein [Bergeriella denitrificans]STZ76202.1 nucleotidyltransferase substrate binding protein, HI0074 family [Bergeriella denitrificans]